MKITLEIDEKYAGVLTVTVIGVNQGSTDVSIYAIDLVKCNYLAIDENAHWTEKKVEE